MAGGMFGTPLYLNEKCILFAVFVIAIYFLPHQKYWQHEIVFVFILSMFAYVLMAWYDYFYDCTDKFGPSFFALFVKWAKPEKHQKDYEAIPVKYKKLVRTVDIGVLVVLLLLVFSPYIRISK
jgi:hypothetical protein